MTEKLELRIIELSKIHNLYNVDDELLDWLFFLINPNSERVINKMKKSDELKQANEKLDKISQDEHMRRIAEWRQKAIIEENTNLSASFERGLNEGVKQGLEQGIKQGLEEGIEQGIEQGISKNNVEVAIKLLKKNMSIEFIQEITHLSTTEIENLKKHLN